MISLGVLVEQNTSLGGFYYCIPERTSLQIPLGTRCSGGFWGPTITVYCCISKICDILDTWGAGLSLYHCVRAELVSTMSLKQLRASMSLKWKLAYTCIRTFGINLQRRSIDTLLCKPDYWLLANHCQDTNNTIISLNELWFNVSLYSFSIYSKNYQHFYVPTPKSQSTNNIST